MDSAVTVQAVGTAANIEVIDGYRNNNQCRDNPGQGKTKQNKSAHRQIFLEALQASSTVVNTMGPAMGAFRSIISFCLRFRLRALIIALTVHATMTFRTMGDLTRKLIPAFCTMIE